eukprot:889179-Prorocentrum_minimum.AAC.5
MAMAKTDMGGADATIHDELLNVFEKGSRKEREKKSYAAEQQLWGIHLRENLVEKTKKYNALRQHDFDVRTVGDSRGQEG